MKIFNRKEKKNENKGRGNDIINQLALQEALRELKTERALNDTLRENTQKLFENQIELVNENKNLKNNLEVLQITSEKIKEICKASKTSKIAKQILQELGE